MSYRDRLTRYGNPSTDTQITKYIYIVAPETITTAKDIAWRDGMIARDIAELEALAADLREYRQALAARYAELETMPYKRLLRLDRHPSWSGRGVTYEITITRILEDGTKQQELREVYEGKERRTALKRYDELLKQYPGIDAEEDIAKRDWER